PSALISLIFLLFVLSAINPLFPLIAFFILVGGGVGIGVMSFYLARKKMRNIFYYYGLIAIWFWSFGFGMFNGMIRR
ncbi:MAG: hypothetical protein KAT65_03255, partial [Methanophagales archaeon]|nr:hypothetical protein [Methanophagales archaeon]